MITASHNKAARYIFDMYLNRLLRKNFTNFYLTNEIPNICKNKPLVITPNHISWWDGFFIDFVNSKIIKRSFHIMMLEEQLKRYWFFRYLGAYSIKRDCPKCIMETTAYLRKITANPQNLNIIYPQGEIEPYDKRPVLVKRGLKYFLGGMNNSVLVLPVLFKIQFEEEMKPAVYCHFAEVVPAEKIIDDYKNYIKIIENALCRLDAASHEGKVISDLFKR